jgi:hypothetical protein
MDRFIQKSSLVDRCVCANRQTGLQKFGNAYNFPLEDGSGVKYLMNPN